MYPVIYRPNTKLTRLILDMIAFEVKYKFKWNELKFDIYAYILKY